MTAPVGNNILGLQIMYTATWSSSGWPTASGGDLKVYSCGHSANCSQFDPNSSPVARGPGTAGSLTWTGGPGELFMVFPGAFAP
ncbi:MAG: hypothetical protein L3K09_00430, partial [Thermoplasmata archaeon]|nr:hypothetical protein [Thermoplasmata archaeon]